jgi:2-oxoglutarate ferredoxin oxidoreductase subunit gamma
MREEIIISGFGGQGVMLIGKFIAYIAMKKGCLVTYMPSYGAEMRGGTANCTTIISSEEIASPLISHPTTALVMNKPSFEKFSPRIRKGGLLILNGSLIDKEPGRDDIRAITVPANKLAEEAGNVRSANMVMLGAYLGTGELATVEKACVMLKDVLPQRWHGLLEVNRKALTSGRDYVRDAGA